MAQQIWGKFFKKTETVLSTKVIVLGTECGGLVGVSRAQEVGGAQRFGEARGCLPISSSASLTTNDTAEKIKYTM